MKTAIHEVPGQVDEKIIILGGGLRFSQGRAVLGSHTHERIAAFLEYLKADTQELRARLGHTAILCSGGISMSDTGGRHIRTTPEAVLMAEQLRYAGIPSERIVVEPTSENTLQNLAAARQMNYINDEDDQVTIVTDAWHVPRTDVIASAVGITTPNFITTGSELDAPASEAVSYAVHQQELANIHDPTRALGRLPFIQREMQYQFGRRK